MYKPSLEGDSNPTCHITGLDTMLGSLSSIKPRLTAIYLYIYLLTSLVRQTAGRLLRQVLGHRKRRSSLLLACRHRYQASSKPIGAYHKINSSKSYFERYHVVSPPVFPAFPFKY